jgi:hypothetical protein
MKDTFLSSIQILAPEWQSAEQKNYEIVFDSPQYRIRFKENWPK